MTASEPNKSPDRLLRLLMLAVLVLACATPLALNLADPDLWGHVHYGQEWITDGELPRTATHTYTAEGYRWINHENIAELLLAGGFASIGVPGMLIAKTLLGLSILGMMVRHASRKGISWFVSGLMMVLVANNLEAFTPLRPQLLSFFFCALMLAFLESAFTFEQESSNSKSGKTKINWRWLLPIPLLMLVWVNSHGGVIAGIAILTAFLFGKAILLLVEKTSSTGVSTWRSSLGLLALLVISCGVLFVNPYGIELIRWFGESLGTPRPEITEWAPALPGNPVFVPFVVLLVTTIVALGITQERRDPVKLVILALVGWQAIEHLRHIAFFSLLCGFWMPIHWQSVVNRLQAAIPTQPKLAMGPRTRGAIVLLLSFTVAIQTTSLGSRLNSLPVYRSNYPIDAIQWMASQSMSGKLVVCFNWAQYAIAALAPEMSVSFDGRFRTCYPQEIVDMNFDFLMGDLGPRTRSELSGPIDGTKVLSFENPDYLLLDRKYPYAVDIMENEAAKPDPTWSLVYQDAVAQVWGRSSVVDLAHSPKYLPASRRLVSNHFSSTKVEWPALPREIKPFQADVKNVAKRSNDQNITNQNTLNLRTATKINES